MLAAKPSDRIRVEDIQYYLVEQKKREWNISDIKENSEYSTIDDIDSIREKEGQINSMKSRCVIPFGKNVRTTIGMKF